MIDIDRPIAAAPQDTRSRRTSSKPIAARIRAITLNCLNQTDDISGAKLTRANAPIHHHAGESSRRVRCSTTAVAPPQRATFKIVTRSPTPRSLSTRLSTAITAPRNGVLIHDARCSGCPVAQAT